MLLLFVCVISAAFSTLLTKRFGTLTQGFWLVFCILQMIIQQVNSLHISFLHLIFEE